MMTTVEDVKKFWDDGIEIVEVREKRHVVKLKGDSRNNQITACNTCGALYIFISEDGNAYCTKCFEKQ